MLRSVTDEIMYELMMLSGQEYVDVYARSPRSGSRPRRRPRRPRGLRRADEASARRPDAGRLTALRTLRRARMAAVGFETAVWRALAVFRALGLAYAVPLRPALRRVRPPAGGWAVLGRWPCGRCSPRRVPPAVRRVAGRSSAVDLAVAMAAVVVDPAPRRPGADRGGRADPAGRVGGRAGPRVRGPRRLAGRGRGRGCASARPTGRARRADRADREQHRAAGARRRGRRATPCRWPAAASWRWRGRWRSRPRPTSGSGWPATSTTTCCRCWRWSAGAGGGRGRGGRARPAGRRAGGRLRALVTRRARHRWPARWTCARCCRRTPRRSSRSRPPRRRWCSRRSAPASWRRRWGRRWTTWRRTPAPAARAWVLVEDEGDEVVVSVRDDGRGFGPGASTRRRADGRLGVAQSIEGRVRDLGGTAAVESAPGAGHRGGAAGARRLDVVTTGDGGRRPPDVARSRGARPDRGRLRGRRDRG